MENPLFTRLVSLHAQIKHRILDYGFTWVTCDACGFRLGFLAVTFVQLSRRTGCQRSFLADAGHLVKMNAAEITLVESIVLIDDEGVIVWDCPANDVGRRKIPLVRCADLSPRVFVEDTHPSFVGPAPARQTDGECFVLHGEGRGREREKKRKPNKQTIWI